MQLEQYQLIKNDCFVFRIGVNDHVCTCFSQSETISWYNQSIKGKYNGTIDALFKVKFFFYMFVFLDLYFR